MNLDFIITEIRRVILVGKEEYPEEKTSFSGKIKNNELIFHLSGESTYFFGDQIYGYKSWGWWVGWRKVV